eukprot:75918_1
MGSEWSEDSTTNNPKKVDKKIDKTNNAFIFSNETEKNITRMDHDREMLIGFWSKGMVSHASIFICYFSEVDGHGLVGRVFCIELFVKSQTKQIVLSIKGPVGNTRGYDCKQFYMVHANMNDIFDIAKETINEHGTYQYWGNNCRHFASNCLNKIKEKNGGLSVDVPAQKLNQYIHTYVTKAGMFGTVGTVGTVGCTVGTVAVASVATVVVPSAVQVLGGLMSMVIPKSGKKKQADPGKAIPFCQVLKKYPLKTK